MIPYHETRGLEVLEDNELCCKIENTILYRLGIIPREFGEVSEGQN